LTVRVCILDHKYCAHSNKKNDMFNGSFLWKCRSWSSKFTSTYVCINELHIMSGVQYSVTQPQAHGRFHTCVWQAFVCHLAGF